MPAHPLQLAIHAQGPAGEIYVRPLEPQGLAHPEPGREGQDVKSLMAVSGLACDAKERARLLGVERLYLFLPDLGRIAARPVDRGLVRPGQPHMPMRGEITTGSSIYGSSQSRSSE